MKTYFLIPNTNRFYDSFNNKWKKLQSTVDFFWVELSLWEVWLMFQQYCPIYRQKLMLIDNPVDFDKFYFWISRDLKRIYQSFHNMPTSAFNNDKEQYVKFNSIEIQTLEELKTLHPERII